MLVFHHNKNKVILEENGRVLKYRNGNPDRSNNTKIAVGTVTDPAIQMCPHCEEIHPHSLKYCQQEFGQDIVLVCKNCNQISATPHKHVVRDRAAQMALVRQWAPQLGMKPGKMLQIIKKLF